MTKDFLIYRNKKNVNLIKKFLIGEVSNNCTYTCWCGGGKDGVVNSYIWISVNIFNFLFKLTDVIKAQENVFFQWKINKLIYTGWSTKISLFFLAINFTKIRKTSRFFLHRYWKFIEFFWWKLSRINNVLLYFFSN